MKYVLLLALSQIADVVTTGFSLAHGATEMNPFARFLIANGGIGMLLLWKALIVVVAAWLVVRAMRLEPKFLDRIQDVLLGMTTFFFGIAALNILVAVTV